MKLSKLLEKSERLGWSFKIWNEPVTACNYANEERNYVELSKYSPAGEDFCMVIDFNGNNPAETFVENLKKYAYDFDENEHVELWLPLRGKGGCPENIKDLLEDATAIKEMINELYMFLSKQE